MSMGHKSAKKTIDDFGNQWSIHGRLESGHWTSKEMFDDHFGELFNPREITGKRVADIGSGSGRIVKMIDIYRPSKLYGIEPSHGFSILRENTKDIKNLELLNTRGEDFNVGDLDLIFSLGVIHHIKNPLPTLMNANQNLKSGGKLVIWLYGYEGNEFYVLLQKLLRPFIRLLPDKVLNLVSGFLSKFVTLYYFMLKKLHVRNFPLKEYLEKVFIPCGKLERKYITFDQLNPLYAKYYKKNEVISLLLSAGFRDVEVFHRHEYSWTAIGTK
jgi:SAM-dependent methyltransferase